MSRFWMLRDYWGSEAQLTSIPYGIAEWWRAWALGNSSVATWCVLPLSFSFPSVRCK